MIVGRTAGFVTRGKLIAGSLTVACALGRGGTVRRKREGDGGTPVGTWRATAVMQRLDREPRCATLLSSRSISPRDGWCDDPAAPRYNRPVRLPFGGGHERLWRDDRLYDAVVVLDFNLRRPRPGRGSAIFFHVAADDLSPTAGCIAVRRRDMRRLLPRLSQRARFRVLG